MNKQIGLGLKLNTKRTRKQVFLDEMNAVVPWALLVAQIEPHSPRAKTGRPPFAIETMLRIHFMQQWFSLSDLAMEEALVDVAMYREFAGLGASARLPDETSILRFRHLLERHSLAQQMFGVVGDLLAQRGQMLKVGSAVDATIIAAPSSTKNSQGQRDPEMHQTRKGQQWYFGFKAHVGTDVGTGLVHTVVVTAANAADVTQVDQLVRDSDQEVFADAGYQGASAHSDAAVQWHIAMRPGKRKALDKTTLLGQLMDTHETLKASVRAKAEHAFRVIKQQFGFTKTSYKGLAKNAAKLHTLFMLSNLWMVRRSWLQAHGDQCA